jgi:hypothetical protein
MLQLRLEVQQLRFALPDEATHDINRSLCLLRLKGTNDCRQVYLVLEDGVIGWFVA